MTTKGNRDLLDWLMIAKTWQRQWTKKHGKTILRALFSYLGNQSLIGNAPVFDASLFDWTKKLEANYAIIRRELENLLRLREYIPCFHEVSPDQRKISTGQHWRTFFLKGFGYESDQGWRQCPKTMEILNAIPNLRTAFFSILGPQYHIPYHRGVTKGLIRCHLALIVPGQRDRCVMKVSDQICQWEEGRCLVFDDTYGHEVWNATDQERIVLLIDVDRPMRVMGRIINKGLLLGIRRSGYVQDARKNLKLWEALYEKAEANRLSAG